MHTIRSLKNHNKAVIYIGWDHNVKIAIVLASFSTRKYTYHCNSANYVIQIPDQLAQIDELIITRRLFNVYFIAGPVTLL